MFARSAIVVSFLMCFISASVSPCSAEHRVILEAAQDLRSLDTFRVIQRSGDTTYTDVTARDLRIGVHGDERRVAVIRPIFRDVVEPFRDWNVRDVQFSVAGSTMTTVWMANLAWGAHTSPEDVFSMPKAPVTSTGLVDIFKAILKSNGSSAVTSGFYFESAGELTDQQDLSVTFWVSVDDPSPFVVELVSPLVPAPWWEVVDQTGARYPVNPDARLVPQPSRAWPNTMHEPAGHPFRRQLYKATESNPRRIYTTGLHGAWVHYYPSPTENLGSGTPAYPNNQWVLYWRSSRRGYAHVWVDGLERESVFVPANRKVRTCIFGAWLNDPGPIIGDHSVWVEVVVPEDSSVRSSLTTVTFSVTTED